MHTLLKTFIIAGTLLLSHSFATTYPLSIKDDLGRNLIIKTEPKRIISLVPSHTETIYALGAGTNLIGRDDYSDYPEAAQKLPKMGGLYNPNLEAIVAAKPDLVLASEYGELPKQLEAAGITVWAGSAQTFDDVFTTIETLGIILNHEDAAQKINNKMRADIKDIETVTRAIKKVSVYYEIDPTPYTVGPNSFLGVLIQKAGGQNIIPAKLGDFPQISPELVLQANPSVIIGASQEDIAKRNGWTNISAVKNKRVVLLTPAQDNILSRAGPRLAQALKILAKILHPDLFR